MAGHVPHPAPQNPNQLPVTPTRRFSTLMETDGAADEKLVSSNLAGVWFAWSNKPASLHRDPIGVGRFDFLVSIMNPVRL